jgi:hypothetical protein
VPNKVSAISREAIAALGRPIELLCSISAGRRIRVAGPDGRPCWVWPDLDQRASAAAKLIARLVPQLSDVAISGPDGGPVETRELGYEEAARRIAFLLVAGRERARAEGAPLHVIEGGAAERQVYHQPEPTPAPPTPRPMLSAYQPPPPDDDAALVARREERLAAENEHFMAERQRHPRHVVITKRNR